MLVFTVLNTACISKSNQYFGLAIGFVIIAGGNAAGWISGGAFNPAVGLCLDASDWSTVCTFPFILSLAVLLVDGNCTAALGPT